MKKNLFLSVVLTAAILLAFNSCKKETDPNVLGGSTNILLTQKDSATSVYFAINGQNAGSVEIKVVSNNNGIVTYGGSADPSTFPDTAITELLTVIPQLMNYYNVQDFSYNIDGTGKLNFQFKLKITSEGMQHNFVDGKPWTAKYGDPQGTTYTLKRTNGDVLTTTVTEKTGQDDWPYGFMYIKTSKVEYNAPATDPVLSKVTFRINHKFGLVYLKTEGKNGKVLEIELVPWFLL
ncbi:MAG: hypothetical protein KIS94_06375 [Chitinophagales bacterium]|nr:hypothetical protein [Chitinophagales bacterium]